MSWLQLNMTKINNMTKTKNQNQQNQWPMFIAAGSLMTKSKSWSKNGPNSDCNGCMASIKCMAEVLDREINYNGAGVKAGSPLSWLEGNTSDFLVTLDHTDFNFQRKATALVLASSAKGFKQFGRSGIYMEVAIGRSKFKNLKQLKII